MDEICSYCYAETADGDTTGWLEEEFGWKCPECRVVRVDDQQPGIGSAGVNGFSDLIEVQKDDSNDSTR